MSHTTPHHTTPPLPLCLKAPAHTTPQCIARIPQIRAELGGRVRGGRGRGVGAHVHTLLQKRSSKSAPPKACARSDLPQGTCAHNPTMHCTHPSDRGRARGQGAGTGAGGGGARAAAAAGSSHVAHNRGAMRALAALTAL